jgi:hypothetical protein
MARSVLGTGGSATGLSATSAWAILVSLDGAAADDWSSMRLILKTSETFVRHWPNRIQIGPLASKNPAAPAVKREAEEDWAR